jgi:site-specific DNA-methyltransferase (adenine-specific)
MEGMKRYPDKHFDLAIVDPPYGIGANREKPHNGWSDYGIKDWDLKKPDETYFQELNRTTKNQIIWGANYFPKTIKPCMGWIFWDKGQREFSLSDGELAFTSFDRALRVFFCSRAEALRETKIHPTQKPAKLYRWLLKNYAKDGNLILDTHLGSGSIAIACYDMGFDLVGFEIDPDYYVGAMKRLDEHQRQMFLNFPTRPVSKVL